MRRSPGGVHLPEIETPTGVQVLELGPGRLSDYGREYAQWLREAYCPRGLQAASFSDYLENKVIDHVNGKTSFTMPATVALALCTVVPSDSSTGATITEAGYTGYARLAIAAGSFAAASSGEGHNNATLTFAACTASSSTIIGFAVCDNSTTGAGNILYWGTCTSTVISTTQTPATIAASGLSLTLD